MDHVIVKNLLTLKKTLISFLLMSVFFKK
jgi:hypothetical protein